MKRTHIRSEVALALAAKGYGPAHFGWVKPGWVEVYNPHTRERHLYNAPASSAFKAWMLADLLEGIEAIGPARVLTPVAVAPAPKQLDIEDAIGPAPLYPFQELTAAA